MQKGGERPREKVLPTNGRKKRTPVVWGFIGSKAQKMVLESIRVAR